MTFCGCPNAVMSCCGFSPLFPRSDLHLPSNNRPAWFYACLRLHLCSFCASVHACCLPGCVFMAGYAAVLFLRLSTLTFATPVFPFCPCLSLALYGKLCRWSVCAASTLRSLGPAVMGRCHHRLTTLLLRAPLQFKI